MYLIIQSCVGYNNYIREGPHVALTRCVTHWFTAIRYERETKQQLDVSVSVFTSTSIRPFYVMTMLCCIQMTYAFSRKQ